MVDGQCQFHRVEYVVFPLYIIDAQTAAFDKLTTIRVDLKCVITLSVGVFVTQDALLRLRQERQRRYQQG